MMMLIDTSKQKKGVRKGDLLSLKLFNIVVDMLALVIEGTKAVG
jgi:hypothetical protein